MNNFYNIKAGAVSKPKPTLGERFGAGAMTNWNPKDSPSTNKTKKQAKLSIGYSLAGLSMLGISFLATNPLTVWGAIGIGLVSKALADNAINSYKLAKIDGLLAKQDVDELMAIVGENKKLQAKLQAYDENAKVESLPNDLKKQCYKAIERQYVAMRNLKIAVEQAQAE